jgi:hypothetical protein
MGKGGTGMSSFINRRKYIRIALKNTITEELGFRNNIGTITVDGIKHTCMIANISISGALISTKDDLKIAESSRVLFQMTYTTGKLVNLKSVVVYTKPMGDMYNSTSYGLEFEEEHIPENYMDTLDRFWQKSTL